MDIDRILKAIKKEAAKSNQRYFECVWREKVENWLTEESKYNALWHWISDKIEIESVNLTLFNPAKKDESYINGYFNGYMDTWKNVAFLVQMQKMLGDERTTDIERQNIEYAVCKVFNVKYNEILKSYV